MNGKGKREILRLYSSHGDEIEFIKVAGIDYNGKAYRILQPVAIVEELQANEAMVFELTKKERDTEYALVTDDSVIDAVFAVYERLWTEEPALA